MKPVRVTRDKEFKKGIDDLISKYDNTLKDLSKRETEEIGEDLIMHEYDEEERKDLFNIRLFQLLVFIFFYLFWQPI
ncbi:MAG TPA: hypothetical protein VNM69_08985 [Bacillus sp. (in: firmicutes)]|nr:hypothetical protein [Bacillus sp. (in: firmicutes)]